MSVIFEKEKGIQITHVQNGADKLGFTRVNGLKKNVGFFSSTSGSCINVDVQYVYEIFFFITKYFSLNEI